MLFCGIGAFWGYSFTILYGVAVGKDLFGAHCRQVEEGWCDFGSFWGIFWPFLGHFVPFSVHFGPFWGILAILG